MNINRSNYEIYFLDYLDGNLPDNQVDDFLDFLRDNPDLNKELKSVSSMSLPKEKYIFQNKELLLKNELSGSSFFDYQSVAFIEGDLSSEDEASFLSQINKCPEQENQVALFSKTKLQANYQITFPGKEKLYKKSVLTLFFRFGSRVAAMLVFVFAIWEVWNFTERKEQPTVVIEQLANEEPEKVFTENKPLHTFVDKTEPVKLLVTDDLGLQSKPANSIPAKIQKEAIESEPLVRYESVPDRIKPLQIKIKNTDVLKRVYLADMSHYLTRKPITYLTVDEYLAQKVLHQKKGQAFRLSSVLNAGISAISNMSQKRMSYETNSDGKVSEISLNTRLLAFSIPLGKDN